MASFNLRIGVLNVQLPVDQPTIAIPGLSSVTPTVAAITPDDLFLNDVNNPLSTTDTYTICVGLLCQDSVNKGYTVTQVSQTATPATIATGQVLKVSMLASGLPTYWDQAVALAIFMKTNSASTYQLQGFGYIDTSAATLNYIVDCKPLRAVPTFTLALLQSTTSDATLGSRTGFGTTYETLNPTTGDTTENMPTVQVPVSPNTGADFNIRTTVSNGFSFQLLSNDLKNFVRAIGGNYVAYTSGGVAYKQAHTALNTAQAVIRGNKPMKLNFPPDSTGFAETKLLIGNLTFNQQELTAAWSKSAPTPISFVFQPAALDTLINSNHTSISHYVEA